MDSYLDEITCLSTECAVASNHLPGFISVLSVAFSTTGHAQFEFSRRNWIR